MGVWAAAVMATQSAHGVFLDVTGQGALGINYDQTKGAGTPTAAVLPGAPDKLYVAWYENLASGVGNIRVSVYNGDDLNPSFARVDSKVNGVPRNPANGINANINNSAIKPDLAVFNSALYAAWEEAGLIRVAQYNGNDAAPNWTLIDGGGLNFNSRKAAASVSLLASGTKLFLAFQESNGKVDRIRVRSYNGSTWSFVDGGTADGLNFSKNAASGARLVNHNGALHVTFTENDGTRSEVRVKAYSGTGSTWTGVDGGGFRLGNGPVAVSPASMGTKLFVGFQEDFKIRVASLSGGVFTVEDGGAGLNYVASAHAIGANLLVTNGMVHTSFSEIASTKYQARIKNYDGVNWMSLDGGGALSDINKDPAQDATSSKLIEFNGKLYYLWAERAGTSSQINISVNN
jgi:hypothetical protein